MASFVIVLSALIHAAVGESASGQSLPLINSSFNLPNNAVYQYAGPALRNAQCFNTTNVNGTLMFGIDADQTKACCTKDSGQSSGKVKYYPDGEAPHCAVEAISPLQGSIDASSFAECCNADVEMCCSLPILGGNVCDETMALNGSFYRCRDRGGFNGSSGVILYDNDKPWVFFDLISSWTNAINASDLKINVVEAAARSGLQLGTLSPNKSAADAATIAANPCVAWRTDGTCKCLAVEATNSSRDCSDEVESPLDPYGEYQSDSTGP